MLQLAGERYRVYFDSRAKTFSLKGKDGYVGLKSDVLWLTNCKFIIYEKARERVSRTRKKTPHAFVEGDLRETNCSLRMSGEWIPFTYNPYKYADFVSTPELKPLKVASDVFLAVVNGKPICYCRLPATVSDAVNAA